MKLNEWQTQLLTAVISLLEKPEETVDAETRAGLARLTGYDDSKQALAQLQSWREDLLNTLYPSAEERAENDHLSIRNLIQQVSTLKAEYAELQADHGVEASKRFKDRMVQIAGFELDRERDIERFAKVCDDNAGFYDNCADLFSEHDHDDLYSLIEKAQTDAENVKVYKDAIVAVREAVENIDD